MVRPPTDIKVAFLEEGHFLVMHITPPTVIIYPVRKPAGRSERVYRYIGRYLRNLGTYLLVLDGSG